MPKFEVDPEIRRAASLPTEFYTDQLFFERSRENIFARSWHFLGLPDEYEALHPATLLPGFIDEPILLSKTESGFACLSNVCTHRGKILVEEPCNANLIRCGYHGRRFSLEGKFLSMPEFDGVENFPSEADDLAQLPHGQWKGFLFAAIRPFASLEDVLGSVPEPAFEYTKLKLKAKQTYDVDAHWALYCENYLEGFHIPYVHRSLNEAVDYGTYTTETFRYASLQTALPKSVAADATQSGDRQSVAAKYLFIFPNLMFNFYPWGISVNIVTPISPTKSSVEFLTYVSDEDLIEQSAGADLHGVEMEDEAVVESVQRGIRSRFYSRGRYSPSREQGTHHFHRLIAEFMN